MSFRTTDIAIPLVILALALVAPACASTTREPVRSEAAAVHREATPSGLESAGDAAASRSDMTRAEEYYVAARSLGGDEARLTRKVIAVCVADERYPVAAMYAEEYLTKHPQDVEMRFAAGALHSAIGQTAAARNAYERVVREKPDLAEAHYALGMLLHDRSEEDPESAKQLQQYLSLQPRGAYAESARSALETREP